MFSSVVDLRTQIVEQQFFSFGLRLGVGFPELPNPPTQRDAASVTVHVRQQALWRLHVVFMQWMGSQAENVLFYQLERGGGERKVAGNHQQPWSKSMTA